MNWGFEVVTAEDGETALQILESDDAPTLAILDWMMPKLDGIAVCSRVRQQANRPYIYLVLLTARSHKEEIATGLEAGAEDFGPSLGTLVARPGMMLAEMVRASTLRIDPQQKTWTGSLLGGAVFHFRIAGTAITFPRCRYYFVATYTHDPERIESINVGTSPSTLSRAELERANEALRAKLAADGWLTGHEEYRGEEDRTLHGGLARGPDGTVWLKNGMVLDIGTRRMDDAAPGENAATAGRWIQFIDLWPHDDYPSIDRYAFAPWKR